METPPRLRPANPNVYVTPAEYEVFRRHRNAVIARKIVLWGFGGFFAFIVLVVTIAHFDGSSDDHSNDLRPAQGTSMQPSEREIKLRAAADAGNAQALLELGWAYSFGDDETWYSEAAKEQAEPYIIPGIHKNLDEAKRLILLSAKHGNVTAMGISASNFLLDHDYAQCAYWARMASARGNKAGIEDLSALRALADANGELMGVTAEQRKAIRDALNDSAGLDPSVGVSQPTTAAPGSPLDLAKINSIDQLARISFGGDKTLFTVSLAEASYSNHQDGNTSYPITVILSIRVRGGTAENIARFGCDEQGNVIAALQLPDPH